MKDLNELLQHAQQLQEQMRQAQEQLARVEVQGESGAGLVRVTMNGRHDVCNVVIDPALMREQCAVLQDLVAAAFNDAVRRVDNLQREKLADATGGMALPAGFKLPF